MNTDAKAHLSQQIVAQIRPILAGKNPDVVGAALADLTAMWLASHVSPGNPEETEQTRLLLLAHHIAGVTRLIGINAENIGTALLAEAPAGRA